LNNGLNILVGDKEAGKSTILEAIHLALSGWIYGKYLGTELSQALFNNIVIKKYLQSLQTEYCLPPPKIMIELYFDIEDESLSAKFQGDGNSLKEYTSGIKFEIKFDEKFNNEYNILVCNGDKLSSIPIEYYVFSWLDFSRNPFTPRNLTIKSALIDHQVLATKMARMSIYRELFRTYLRRKMSKYLKHKER
jgi:putative ATP-dependent endonuclease of OLD family